MTTSDIDFSKIRVHGNSQNDGFEELCVQLFRGEHGSIESVNRVEGSGGDGGVEAFIRQDDNVWGMQAKYWSRLEAPQWRQLKKSVTSALNNHPTLIRYEVMAPLNRSQKKIAKWDALCEEWQDEAKTLGFTHDVEFIWIGESELVELLTTEKYGAKKSYWFDNPGYGLDDLQTLNDSSISDLDLKYTPKHHVSTLSQDILSAFCDPSVFLKQYRSISEQLIFAWQKFHDSSSVDSHFRSIPTLQKQYNAIESAWNFLYEHINEGVLSVPLSDLTSLNQNLLDAFHEAGPKLSNHSYSHREKHKTPDYQGTPYSSVSRELRQLEDVSLQLSRLLRKYQSIDHNCLLILGDAGAGKSHLLANQVEASTEKEQPTAFFLGEYFSSSTPIEDQIIGISQFDGSFADFLAFLEVEAEIHQTSALILIDAVNESENRKLWRSHLGRFVKHIERFSRIRLVVSCRTDFTKITLPPAIEQDKATSWGSIHHSGFQDNLFEAVSTYFSGYNVKSEHLPPLLPEFQNPLFLKTVCEAYSNTELQVDSLTLKKIMERRLEVLYEKIETDIDCESDDTSRCLRMLSHEMTQRGTLSIPRDRAIDVCREVFSVPVQSRSLYTHLKSNGFLVELIDHKSQELVVRYQYERFANYFIAEELLDGIDTSEQLEAWWSSEGYTGKIKDYAWFYDQRGLLGIFSILFPEKYGIELLDLCQPDHIEEDILRMFAESLLWRKSICDTTEGWLETVRDYDPSLWLDTQLKVSTVPEHPFNAFYLDSTLSQLSLTQLELEWTITINHYDDYRNPENSPLSTLLSWIEYHSESISADQSELLGIVCLWICSTTNKKLRNRATFAAVKALKMKSEVAAMLLDRFSNCKDPYIQERLYAVAAGVAKVECDNEKLTHLASTIHRLIFNNAHVHPHILLRDYARSIIEVAHYRGATIEASLLDDCRPPYQSIFPEIIGEEEIKPHEDDYSSPYGTILRSLEPNMRMGGYGDFGRYVMQYKIEKFSKWLRVENPSTKELKESFDATTARRWIFSRLLKLGWAPETFSEYDDSVRSASRSEAAIERIGKKYQWIGLYEFCGYLSDHYHMSLDWNNERREYQIPPQVGIHGLDPCLAFCSDNDEWINAHAIQFQYPDPFIGKNLDNERKSWVDSAEIDLISPLITVDSSDEKLLLCGNFEWNEQLPFGQHEREKGKLKMWVHVRSYLVTDENKENLLTQLRTSHFYGNGICLESVDDSTLGDYPWSPSNVSVRQYCEGKSSWLRDVNVPLFDTVCGYSSERENVRGFVPSPQLCDFLNLQWSGKRFDYTNDGKNSTFESVSTASAIGPEVAIIDKKHLIDSLKSNGLNIVWCVVAERSCWDGNTHPTQSEGEHSSICYFEDDKLVEEKVHTCINHFDSAPNQAKPEPIMNIKEADFSGLSLDPKITKNILEGLENLK